MSRKDAREMVMRLLFQRDFDGQSDSEPMDDMEQDFNLDANDFKYISDVQTGCQTYQSEIDECIKRFSKGWPLQRIAKVDLAILRLALYEIYYRSDIPSSVSINEAVELAKKYGSDKSASYVNGVLGNVVRSLKHGGEETK